MRVFVCYTTRDPAVTMDRLQQVEALLRPFAKVFVDLLHNKQGNQSRVNRELRRSDIILQIVSPKHTSEWVQKEVVSARRKGKPIIKVEIDELLKKDSEQIYLMLTDVDKKGWSVLGILGVSLTACVVISIMGLWLSYLFVSGHLGVESKGDLLNARGLFGDSWGGVNAIISAFAFAGVIVTLFLQNRDLNLQRKEMARQREEFEKENSTLKYQRFENLFYNMLTLQQKIVDDLKVEYDVEEFSTVPLPTGGQGYENRKAHRELTGREVFRYTFEDEPFLIKVKPEEKFQTKGIRNVLHFQGLKAYDDYWSPTIFDHYFRHMYKILQFIDTQDFSFEESYRYVSLLRGTLSRHELVWIYYNALQPQYSKLKDLVEKYTLLKNLRPELLTLTSEARMYYKGLGVTDKDLRDHKFSSRDFEFYLTDDPAEKKKYQLSAFWNAKEMDTGKQFLASWNAYINGNASKVIETEPKDSIKESSLLT